MLTLTPNPNAIDLKLNPNPTSPAVILTLTLILTDSLGDGPAAAAATTASATAVAEASIATIDDAAVRREKITEAGKMAVDGAAATHAGSGADGASHAQVPASSCHAGTHTHTHTHLHKLTFSPHSRHHLLTHALTLPRPKP